MIHFMCWLLHEEPYQAKMDLASLCIVTFIIWFGWDIIKAHIQTLGKDSSNE